MKVIADLPDVGALDMRASPYDLVDLGYPPVPIENADGRAEYARHQRDSPTVPRAACGPDRLLRPSPDLMT